MQIRYEHSTSCLKWKKEGKINLADVFVNIGHGDAETEDEALYKPHIDRTSVTAWITFASGAKYEMMVSSGAISYRLFLKAKFRGYDSLLKPFNNLYTSHRIKRRSINIK